MKNLIATIGICLSFGSLAFAQSKSNKGGHLEKLAFEFVFLEPINEHIEYVYRTCSSKKDKQEREFNLFTDISIGVTTDILKREAEALRKYSEKISQNSEADFNKFIQARTDIYFDGKINLLAEVIFRISCANSESEINQLDQLSNLYQEVLYELGKSSIEPFKI